jgi:GNAT superfamily N-acetyltransferase
VSASGPPHPNCINFSTWQGKKLMQLRDGRTGDAVAVVGLWTQGYVTEGEGGRVEPYVAADFDETVRRGRVFVAECEGELVGVVALFAPDTPDLTVARDDEAELSRLVVAPSARGRRVGATLVRRCVELAQAEGWPAIALWSREYQVAAHHLYESLGFHRLPDRNTIDETGHARLVFVLTL